MLFREKYKDILSIHSYKHTHANTHMHVHIYKQTYIKIVKIHSEMGKWYS